MCEGSNVKLNLSLSESDRIRFELDVCWGVKRGCVYVGGGEVATPGWAGEGKGQSSTERGGETEDKEEGTGSETDRKRKRNSTCGSCLLGPLGHMTPQISSWVT